MRVTIELSNKEIGCGRVPSVFWGSEGSQGWGDGGARGIRHRCTCDTIAHGLILMGAWCGSDSEALLRACSSGKVSEVPGRLVGGIAPKKGSPGFLHKKVGCRWFGCISKLGVVCTGARELAVARGC
jgi:hypothetical protein